MTLHLGDSELRQTDCVKYLGVHIDSNLSWNRHIQQIESKLSAAFGTLYQLHKYVPKKALLQSNFDTMPPFVTERKWHSSEGGIVTRICKTALWCNNVMPRCIVRL